jgi:hypothetical protein
MFEVSLEGLGASAQDIEALRRIRALIVGKTVAAQQEQEMRSSSSQAQPSQQDVAPPHAAPDTIDFIRQTERYLALLQSQIADASPSQQAIPTPIAPAPTPTAHAAPAAQQHAWHTLQAMQAQLDQWRQQKDAFEGQSIGHRQERV